MLRLTKIISVIMVIAVFIATWAMLGTVVAQKAAVPKPQDKLALGEEEVKQITASPGYRQERQNLQARVDKVYGSGVPQTRCRKERRN